MCIDHANLLYYNCGQNQGIPHEKQPIKEFGKLIGVSAQAIRKWEQNTCYPDIIFLPHLARILNCTTDDFFEIHGGDANE